LLTAAIQGLLIGAVLGFVLHRGGLTRYTRIIGALLLRDLKAIKFMFGSVAVASLGYGLAAALDLGLVPRVNLYLGPAHFAGGVIFGVGMGLAGL